MLMLQCQGRGNKVRNGTTASSQQCKSGYGQTLEGYTLNDNGSWRVADGLRGDITSGVF